MTKQTTAADPTVTGADSQPVMPTNPALYAEAIEQGKAVIAAEGSKAAAAREIYRLLHGEQRDVILRAFIEGATITVKGAPTYLYNVSRKFRRLAKTEGVTN